MQNINCSLCWEVGKIEINKKVGDYDFFICSTCLDLGFYYAIQQNAMGEQGIILYSCNKPELILKLTETEFDDFLIQFKKQYK